MKPLLRLPEIAINRPIKKYKKRLYVGWAITAGEPGKVGFSSGVQSGAGSKRRGVLSIYVSYALIP